MQNNFPSEAQAVAEIAEEYYRMTEGTVTAHDSSNPLALAVIT